MLVVAAIVLVSRLPFLTNDYGLDPDAWRAAYAATRTYETGEYHASRYPGYPVPDIAAALLHPLGPRAINAAAAILSVLAATSFAGLLRRAGCRDATLCGLALAFVPVVYVNSTNAMDYIWSLGFAMAAWHAAACRKPIIAGILLGLAIGSRLTAGAMLVPIAISMAANSGARKWLRQVSVFGIVSLGVGTVCFLPVFLRYGTESLRFVDTPRLLGTLLKHATVGVWGDVGSAGLLGALLVTGVVWLVKRGGPASRSLPRRGTTALTWASGVAVMLFGVAFLRLPHEPGYLIPAVPFVIVLAARFAPRAVTVAVCVLLLGAPFVRVTSVRADQPEAKLVVRLDPGSGPVIRASRQRVRRAEFLSVLLAYERRLEGKYAIEARSFLPMIRMSRMGGGSENVRYHAYLTSEEKRSYRRQGYRICELAWGANPPLVATDHD